MGLHWLLFPTNPLLLGYETRSGSTRCLAYPNQGCRLHFPHKFLELLWISHSLSKWIFLCSSINGHKGPPLIMLTIRSRTVVMFWEALSPISFTDMSFWYPFLEPHIYHSNIGVRLREVTKLGIHVYLIPIHGCLRNLPLIPEQCTDRFSGQRQSSQNPRASKSCCDRSVFLD